MGDDLQTLEVDVLFVGGGPANLAGALRLTQLVSQHHARAASAPAGRDMSLQIALIEKGRDCGAHAISGAIFNPVALAELLPDYREEGFPFSTRVARHGLHLLTAAGQLRIPDMLIPPAYRQDGCYVGSLQHLNLWLAGRLESAGVYVFNETCGVEVVYDGDRVCGVRTGAKGLAAGGGRKPNYEPGTTIRAKVTVFGEGPRGTLTEDVIHRFKLRTGRNPQSYALGVKEVIRVKHEGMPGLTLHTVGYPLDPMVFGGGFCYGLDDHHYAVGMVCGLDWGDPRMDAHAQLQRFKAHPFIQQFIEGGNTVAYGAKTLPEGGYFAIPTPYVDGAVLVGDSAGFVNVPYLKGIHYAMKSGMLAAETVFDALLADNTSAAALAAYETRLQASYVMRDLYRVRSFRRAFSSGLYRGLLWGGLAMWTGLGSKRPGGVEPDFTYLRPAAATGGGSTMETRTGDAAMFVDKLTDVFHSGTQHREDQPSHIQILDPGRCLSECLPRFGEAPCTHFCPAKVYELVGEGVTRRIQVNFANCVHCKTCVIKDPIDVVGEDNVQNIVWRAPAEGGPRYQGL
jgi:electron-transferring-flavoprotein dehydrogenase